MSISLWDLKQLAGLPILGEFYDEVTPSLEEITGVDAHDEPVLPFSCRFLFYAYHLARTSGDNEKNPPRRVSISSWVSWWFRGPSIYDDPQKMSIENDLKRMKLPSGLPSLRERTREEEEVFDDLGVDSDDRDEIYLAAFLVTWLCCFVLPSNRGPFIRPETFKIAALMARGIRFCLAIPVLASIYNGMNCIATSEGEIGKNEVSLPWHFVYAWIAEYFDVYRHSASVNDSPEMCGVAGRFKRNILNATAARALFQENKNSSWHPTRKQFSEETAIVESSEQRLDDTSFEYLVATRSCYLTLRRGNFYLVEPYSPHRFARQFGYCQDLPGLLSKDIRNATLRELVFLWKCSLYRYTPCRLLCPASPLAADRLVVTKRFIKWWKDETSDYFENSKVQLIQGYSPGFRVLPCSRGLRHLNRVTPLIESRIGEDEGIVYELLDKETSRGEKRKSVELGKNLSPRSDESDRCNQRRYRRDNVAKSTSKERSTEHAMEIEVVHKSPPNARLNFQSSIRSSSLEVVAQVEPSPYEGTDNNEIINRHNEDEMDSSRTQSEERQDSSTSKASIGDEGKIYRVAREFDAEKRNQVINDTASSRGRNIIHLSLKKKKKEVPKVLKQVETGDNHPAVSLSTFQPARVARTIRNGAIAILRRGLLEELKKTPYARISDFQKTAQEIYENIQALGGESSELQWIIEDYTKEVNAFLLVEKRIAGKKTDDQLEARIAEAESSLRAAMTTLEEVKLQDKTCQNELISVEEEITSLEESLQHLRERKTQLTSELKQYQQVVVAEANAKAQSSQKELEKLMSDHTTSQREIDELKALQEDLDRRREELDADIGNT